MKWENGGSFSDVDNVFSSSQGQLVSSHCVFRPSHVIRHKVVSRQINFHSHTQFSSQSSDVCRHRQSIAVTEYCVRLVLPELSPSCLLQLQKLSLNMDFVVSGVTK